jgi:prevent-host-death family protein
LPFDESAVRCWAIMANMTIYAGSRPGAGRRNGAVQVNIAEAKNRLSLLIKAARAGEDVVIANRGEPVARLVPTRASAAVRTLGSGRAILDWLKSHPVPAYARRSAEEIDVSIEEERSAWD